jgi:hypothetical protein
LGTFWFGLVWRYVDGGLVGALFSHGITMLLGTFLYDWNLWVQEAMSVCSVPLFGRLYLFNSKRTVYFICVGSLFGSAVLLMLSGFLMTLIPVSPVCWNSTNRQLVNCSSYAPSYPFVAPSVETPFNMWALSQRSAPVPYQLFSSGMILYFSHLVIVFLYILFIFIYVFIYLFIFNIFITCQLLCLTFRLRYFRLCYHVYSCRHLFLELGVFEDIILSIADHVFAARVWILVCTNSRSEGFTFLYGDSSSYHLVGD